MFVSLASAGGGVEMTEEVDGAGGTGCTVGYCREGGTCTHEKY